MPLLRVSIPSLNFDVKELSTRLSQEMSVLTNKPENYIMVIIDINQHILFSRSSEPSAYLEVKSIGSLNPKKITKDISRLLGELTGINPSRIYMTFEDIKASNWGHNETTFG